MVGELQILVRIVSYSLPIFSALFCIILLCCKLINYKHEKFIRRVIFLLLSFYFLMVIYVITIFFYYFNKTLFTYNVSVNFFCMLAIVVVLYHLVFKLTRLRKEEKFNLYHYAFPILIFLIFTVWMFMIPLDFRIMLIDKKPLRYAHYRLFAWFFESRFYIRISFSLFYLYLGIKRIVIYRRKIINYSADLDGSSLMWLYRIILCIIIIFPAPVAYFYLSKYSFAEYIVIVLTMSFLFVFNIILCYNIFAVNFLLLTEDILLKEKEIEISLTRKPAIDPEIFEQFMESEKPYLRHDLKITDLVSTLSTNRTYLSRFINNYYKMNFSLYINKCRLQELERLKADSNNNEFDDEELIYNAGFKSVGSYQRTKRLLKKVD